MTSGGVKKITSRAKARTHSATHKLTERRKAAGMPMEKRTIIQELAEEQFWVEIDRADMLLKTDINKLDFTKTTDLKSYTFLVNAKRAQFDYCVKLAHLTAAQEPDGKNLKEEGKLRDELVGETRRRLSEKGFISRMSSDQYQALKAKAEEREAAEKDE